MPPKRCRKLLFQAPKQPAAAKATNRNSITHNIKTTASTARRHISVSFATGRCPVPQFVLISREIHEYRPLKSQRDIPVTHHRDQDGGSLTILRVCLRTRVIVPFQVLALGVPDPCWWQVEQDMHCEERGYGARPPQRVREAPAHSTGARVREDPSAPPLQHLPKVIRMP